MEAASGNTGELFLKLAEGDETAFRQLFDAYRLSFHAAAFKLTRSADLAEEVVQDVFVALWEKRIQVAAARSPHAYLVTMLHNKIYFHFRGIILERRARQKAADDVALLEDNPVEELLLAKEHRELLKNIISKLPPQQQLVYRLAKQEGLSREEIAQKLNISPNTVRNHMAAAVAFLRDYFKRDASSLIWIVILAQL